VTFESWNNVHVLDQIAYDMLLADYTRGKNRALIANLANGVPPYTTEEAEENKIVVNVNDLSMTRLQHDARAQFYNGFLKPGQFFTCRTDYGPRHKRHKVGAIITREMNRPMKKSINYFEQMRSKFSLLVLHGIAPAVWENEDKWCPRPIGIEDALIPSQTLLGFENLPLFALRRSFTGMELQKITRSSVRDPGWNMPMVERCLAWLDKEGVKLYSSNWPEVWSPEKTAERLKSDNALLASDQVPTVDCFDIYGYVEDGERSGWVRRIILDAWGNPFMNGGQVTATRKDGPSRDMKADDFLFNSGERFVATTWQNVISFQFADLSAVAPFRYHSVRSLGFLLYSVCHLQNRLRCKFNEAVFEALMQLYRVKSMDEAQRALKLQLANQGFIDESLSPVPANERWQPNEGLIGLGLSQNQQLMSDNASSMSQNKDFSRDKTEKTKFQVMAELQQATSLVSAALAQAYMYQSFEYREIVRRFFKAGSTDVEVLRFRANCFRQGVGDKYFDIEAWDIESERVMGAGNKTLEMTIAQQLMEWRQLFAPQSQNKVLELAVLALTDDAKLADELVPEAPKVTDSIHDTEIVFGTIMSGSMVTPKPGLNPIEVAGTMLRLMAAKVQELMQTTQGVGTPQGIQGLALCEQYTAAFIGMLAMDETQKSLVKKLRDELGKLMNVVKAMAQRQAEMQKKAAEAQPQQGNGQMDPKDQAKIQATIIGAQTKAKLAQTAHAQKTAQRQISFEQKQKEAAEKHKLDLATEGQKHKADIAAKDLTTVSEIQHQRLKSLSELSEPKGEE
jgi:hypothetical protein